MRSDYSRDDARDEPLRLVMMGTGPFAVPAFDALCDAGHVCLTVFTRPERPAQGKKTTEKSPVRVWAEARKLDVVAPESANDREAGEILRRLEPDLLVVCDYGQILKKEVLQLARLGGINLHGSLLPAHRGAAPVQWAVLSGDSETGVSVIHMTPRLDAGPIITIRSTPIDPHETAGELERRLALLGVEATLEAVELLSGSNDCGSDLPGMPQEHALASKAPRLQKSDGRIDWQRPATEIGWHVRGMQPWPGAFNELDLNTKAGLLRLAITKVCDVEPASEAQASEFELEPAGCVVPGTIRVCDQRLYVATGDLWLEIARLKPAGKREMEATEWLRGVTLPADARLV